MELLWKGRGCMPIDVHVCFKKLYSHAEVDKKSLLAFYLKKYGLGDKADMLYNRMWRIYSEAKVNASQRELHSSIDMREVVYYCVIDTLRCQELMVKKNVINDYRKVASIAYVSLFNSYYRANGVKVRNLLNAYAFKHNMLFSTRVSKNIEKDKIILTYREADIVQNNGSNLYKIEFPFNNHIVQARSVRHDNQFKKKGLFPVVLEDLFNKRVELKAQLAPLEKKKKQFGKIISSAKERDKRVPESLISEYLSICFNYDYFDSKQKALKVYMNTFYGKAGNLVSPIYLLKLAGGITSAGKYNLNLVVEFVSGKGFEIKYGNTDSLYLKCPDKYYEKCDRVFNERKLSKEEYWAEIVNITIGIDTVKQGQFQLFKFIEKKIVWEAIDINNMCSIHEIVEDTLREAQNNYVVIKGPLLYNKQDRKELHRVEDYMEYADNAKELNMEIDINYYLEKMVGMCTRFINENDIFQPPPSHKIMQLKDSDEKEKQIDTYSQDEAKKWLKKYIKDLQ
ncbi:hypothetical protein C1645_815172 [Glomus cerebriforme]|uniref:DNA-directed DNA polymerase n=1 Tax=Glomus cerebriforme TaxID=658196 RepID=A0A397TNM3_9GLOM|nr:hypothetical protein C1645_815172 [Glomus cerebriforme]